MEHLKKLVGVQLGPSAWFTIDQARINLFADATNDHQFIHVDAEKAKAGAFGTTIAHGFLTLSLLPSLTAGLLALDGVEMGVNYGSDKVRFLTPVKVNQRVRAIAKLVSVEEKRPGQWLLKQEITVEIEGEQKPALIAETLMLVFLRS